VLAYVAEQAETIRATDPQVRRDAPEAVHDMRVACRRMRSSFQSFRALLDRSRTDDLVVELRWLAGELGGAATWRSRRRGSSRTSRRCRPSSRSGPVAAQTTRFFATRRASAAATATGRPGQRPLPRAARRRRRAAGRPAADRRRGPPGGRDPAGADRQAVRRTRKHLRAAHAHPPGHERDLELHEMRKAGKRLRYAAEVSEPALGAEAKRLVKR
jgi:hypothetical protein